MASQSTYMKRLYGIWLCFAFAFGKENGSTSLEILVPQIEQPNFKLHSSGQHYSLKIELPDGSTRVEDVELRHPSTPEQELFVKGKVKNIFSEGLYESSYEAGQLGYEVEYVYQNTERSQQKPVFYLSSNALKSAAG